MAIVNNCSTNIEVSCPDPISANCVYWPGEDISCIDVCISKPVKLTYIVKSIGELVCSLQDSVDVSNVTVCEAINVVGNKTIASLIQALSDYCCSIKTAVDDVEEKLDEQTVNITLDFKCLNSSIDPCEPINPSDLQQVLQVIINNICEVKTEFNDALQDVEDTISDTIDTFLNGLVYSNQPNRVIAQSNPRKFRLRGFVPPHTYLPYAGSLTNFDGSGKGTGSMEGWYLANGNNGTIDMRGVVPIGAIQGVGGGSLPNYVNPSLNPVPSGSTTANIAVGTRGGKITNTLGVSNLPAHNHPITVNTSGIENHKHAIFSPSVGEETTITSGVGNIARARENAGNDLNYAMSVATGGGLPPSVGLTGNAVISGGGPLVTATIGNTGSSNPIDNRMPFIGFAWIVMLD